MRNIKFAKMVAAGNDFVVIEKSHQVTKSASQRYLAQQICDRKYGVGADGLLLLEKSRVADIRMRIFNADGSEAEMCGNGARCVAFWMNSELRTPNSRLKIETQAGIIRAEVDDNKVKINLTDPKDIKLGIPIEVAGGSISINFINTGVPHTVIFVEGLEKIDVFNLGRSIRRHKKFSPEGTNVDFVEVVSRDTFKIRTYERGVEDETSSCGTGSVAAALVFALKTGAAEKINVHTASGEMLKVYFRRHIDVFRDIWLEGRVKTVFRGEFSLKRGG